MTRRMMGMATGMLVLVLAGCAGESTGPAPVDTERAQLALSTQNLGPADTQRTQLVQRTQDLVASVGATGRLSTQDRGTLTALARDVDNWLVLNGQGSASLGSGGLRQASRTSAGGTGGTCSGVCVPVVVMGDLICFTTGYTCIGTQKRCLYDCFFNLDALPVRRA